MPTKIGTFVLADDSVVDAHSQRVLVSGIDVKRFKSNPVVLFNHRRSTGGFFEETKGAPILPIGIFKQVKKVGSQLVGTLHIDENDDFAVQVGNKIQAGILKGVSVGIRINAISDAPEDKMKGQKGVTIIKSELLEVSVVDIPANPKTLAIPESIVSKSIDGITELEGEGVEHHLSLTLEPQSKVESKKSIMNFEAIKNAIGKFFGKSIETEEDLMNAIPEKSLAELNEELTKSIEDKVAENKTAQTEVNDELATKMTGIEDTVKGIQDSLAKMEKTSETAEKQIADLTKANEDLQKSLDTKTEELAKTINASKSISSGKQLDENGNPIVKTEKKKTADTVEVPYVNGQFVYKEN